MKNYLVIMYEITMGIAGLGQGSEKVGSDNDK